MTKAGANYRVGGSFARATPRARVAIVAFLLGFNPALAGADKGGGAESAYQKSVEISVSPEELVLGEVRSVEVVVKSPGDSVPNLFASVGRIGAARLVSPRVYAATLELPQTRFPQYAIIAAVDRERNFGWRVLPLMARARIEVDSDPQVNVSVRLRLAEFGPVVTDKRGRAEVEVLVPPGLSHAVSVAQDSLGNTSFKQVPLRAPALNRLLALCPRGAEHMLVIAVSEDGTGETRASFDVASQEVSVKEPRRLQPGAFLVPFDVPQGVAAGAEASFDVTLNDSRATCQLKIPLEEPTAVTMTADTAVLNADDSTEVNLRVFWTFPGLRAMRRMDPHLEVSLGTTAVETISEREQLVRWRIPKFFAGNTSSSIRLTYTGGVALTAGYTVTLIPGKLAQIRLSTSSGPLLANGRNSTRVRLIPTDAHRNRQRLVDPKVRLSGSLTPLKRQPDGSYLATYRTIESYDPVADQITVTDASGVTGSLAIRLIPRQPRFWATVKAGYLENLGRIHAPYGTLGVGLRLPIADENLVVGLEVGAYHSQSRSSLRTGGSLDFALTGVPVLSRVGYEIPLESVLRGLRLYPAVVGGGLWTSIVAENSSSIQQSRDDTVAVFGGLIGANVPFGPGRPSLELGFYQATLDRAWIRGNAAGFQGTIGYAFAP